MKKTFAFFLILMSCLLSGTAFAQSITDGSYRTIGFIKSDGTIQNANYRTIGHANGVPMKWAAFFFFFTE